MPLPVNAKHFLLSLLIVLAAFAAGRYAFPTTPAPASAPRVTNVNAADAESTAPTLYAPAAPLTTEEALAYTPDELHTIRLFEGASPSVCYITTKSRRRDFWSRNVTEVPAGSGSAFVWDDEGHIITNFHVIREASRAIVTLANGEEYDAKLVGYAREKDLAVLRIDAPRSALVPIPVGTSSDIRVGQSVYAIGNPFGLDQTLTTGVVSALDREIKSQAGVPIRGVIQSDAAINPGNSGGPLLDSRGLLIGVNTAIYSPSGASAGIGFSIPVDVVRYVIPDLIRYGEVRRASLGLSFYPRWRGEGLAIESVSADGPSARSGVRGLSQNDRGNWVLGDVLRGINGTPVNSTGDVFLALETYEPGQEVILDLVRDERELRVRVVLGSSVE